MSPVKVWHLYKQIFQSIAAGDLLEIIVHILNVFCDILLPNGLPKHLRRRLSIKPPQIFGEAMLCSMCHKIFTSHNHETKTFISRASYRHQDDLVLLERSANSGCDICRRLYEWVSSIENGPDWSDYFGVNAPWGFTIRSRLSKRDKDNHFILEFTILRWEFWDMTNDNMFHTLILKIVPTVGKSALLFNAEERVSLHITLCIC
jgi:hypothetical protein